MPSKKELVATKWSADEREQALSAQLGADSLTYLSQQGVHSVVGDRVCDACFTGRYVVPVSEEERSFILKERRG